MELLVGQTAAINLQMALSGVAETVTVTAETPLVNTVHVESGRQHRPAQVQELPVAQRNWMGLALLAPGSRTSPTNAAAPLPDRHGGDTREFQLNVDGQQVSSELGAGNQPRYSQDSIAEFQFIANRFDATLGRSTGVLVNAITKSGTNKFAGLFRTNFQSTSFNAPDPIANKVLPISDQQYSTAVGGPIVREQAALLRQLRERAASADQRLDDEVHGVQRGAAGDGDSQHRRRAGRLSVVAEDAPDGEGLRPAHLHAVWRRLVDDRRGVDRSTTTRRTASTSAS